MARRIIGFDRKIALSWLDATADWAAQGLAPAAIRQRLGRLLDGQVAGAGLTAHGKTMTVLLRVCGGARLQSRCWRATITLMASPLPSMPTIEPVAVPLREEPAGVYRIGDTRVLLEVVVDAFRSGATPETIVQSYDTLRLADVYAVLAYCLTHQEQIDDYMRRHDAEAADVRRTVKAAQPDRRGLRERLMRRAKDQPIAPSAQ